MNFRATVRAIERDNKRNRQTLNEHLDHIEAHLGVRSSRVARTDSLTDGRQYRTSRGEILSVTRLGAAPTEPHTDAAERLELLEEKLEQLAEPKASGLREKLGLPPATPSDWSWAEIKLGRKLTEPTSLRERRKQFEGEE